MPVSAERRAQLEALLAAARENTRTLATCARHDFSQDLTPECVLGKRWRCTRCGGEVDALAKGWYEDGLRHASTT